MKFSEIVEQYNIPRAPYGHHHNTEGWINIDCPFCSKDSHRYRMGYNIAGGFMNCWVCGSHTVFSVLKEYLFLPDKDIKKLIDNIDGIVGQVAKKENLTGHLIMPANVGKLQTAHIGYLNKRRFNHKEIERLWQVKGIGMSGRLQWSLFIPIQYEGKTVSWTTRAIGSNRLRYVSAAPDEELIPHKNILYGIDYVRDTVIIVEGPLDVWRIGPGAVATFGSSFTIAQVIRLAKIPKRIICYDNEEEAQKQAQKLFDILGILDGETMNVTLDSKDPDAANPYELKELRKFLKK